MIEKDEYDYGNIIGGYFVDDDYELPDWVKNKIPRHIYAAIAVELYNIFVPKDLRTLLATHTAIERVSAKFNLPWLLNYYNGMDHKDYLIRQVFDWELMEEIKKEFEWFTQPRTSNDTKPENGGNNG